MAKKRSGLIERTFRVLTGRSDGRGDLSDQIERAYRLASSQLDLSGQEITELPQSIGRLTQLRSLNLSNNGLTDLPASLGQLTDLQTVGLSENQLTALPESLGQLTQLRDLNLADNQLTALPESLGQLTQLRELYLHGNELTTLPESLGQLTELRELYLNGNQLAALPESLGQLAQLRILDFSNNQLTVLPESLGYLSQLQCLALNYNQVTVLPESLGQLAQLQYLALTGNQLTALPESLGQLAQLQYLALTGNQLTALPESLGQLAQLQDLYLSGNQLTALPESLGQLAQLRELYVNGNQLSELPDSLRNLTSLKQLFLHGNDALGMPLEVLGPTGKEITREKQFAKPADILEYYFRVRRGRRPLNEAKLILVGRGAVGKTSIVNRLVYGIFKDEKKTEGINITEWKLRLTGKEEVRLNIWDFGGQEIMHATHQFFLTQRSLYLLVLNGREGGEDADAEYWLKLIESFGGDSPVIVVLNKIKEHPFDVNRRALQQKYPIREIIKTDCADGTGIEELRSAIERETDRLEDLRKAFPAGWFDIKDQLASMKDNYVSFERYREICREHGEMDEKAQQDLSGFLHRLGIVLNYRDDPRLQDTHVLSPHWVTNGIYKILNSEKLEKKKGEIRLNDLAKVLDKTEYPATMRRFIFDLMKKFELCFSFPEDDTHYLIPELLDKQQPVEADEFKPEECLNFQYHYPVLPEGLLPRFIVRTHVLSEGQPRWRTGVIMRFEGCRALVKADVQDKKVLIYVSGPASNRRRLLAVIRSDFERIHSDIRNLQPREMVPIPDYPDVPVAFEKLLAMERQGILKFHEYVGDRVIEVEAIELLNGVDAERRARRRREIFEESTAKASLFISYSHKDESLRNELDTHLKILQRSELIDVWHDRKIEAGDDWKKKIDENLERADIILLLLSPDFIASDYCHEIEAKRALERHRQGEARVIPVVFRPCNWQTLEVASLQSLPRDGLPITQWKDKDSAWLNVEEGIEIVVKELRKLTPRLRL
jgi:internalin A